MDGYRRLQLLSIEPRAFHSRATGWIVLYRTLGCVTLGSPCPASPRRGWKLPLPET